MECDDLKCLHVCKWAQIYMSGIAIEYTWPPTCSVAPEGNSGAALLAPHTFDASTYVASRAAHDAPKQPRHQSRPTRLLGPSPPRLSTRPTPPM